MSLSGPSTMLPNTGESLGGAGGFSRPSYTPPPAAAAAPNPNQAANLTPQMLGGPSYQGSMDQNGQWKREWQDAYNHWNQTKDPNAARMVQLIQQGYSLNQISSGVQQGAVTNANAQSQVQDQGPLLQQMIRQQTASDPTIAGLKQSNALLGIQGNLQNQNFDAQRQQLQADTQNNLSKLGIQLKNTQTDKAYGSTLVDAAHKEYGVGVAAANTSFNSNLQQLYSDATSRGAITTGGTKDTRSNLQQQLVEGVAGAGVTQEREVARGTHMMQTADQQAQSLGLDRQGYVNSLNFGLQSIGLNQSISAVDLMDKANSTNAQQAAAAQAIIQNLTNLAQQNPDLVKNWAASQPNTSSSVTGGSKRY